MIKKILSPIKGQLPFMAFFMVLMSFHTFDLVISQLTTPMEDYSWLNVAGQFAVTFLFGYLFAILLQTFPKKWLKITIYSIVVILFGITIYLYYNFGMAISPQAFVLLAETNSNEAKEFASMFLLNPRSLATYATIVLVVAAIFFSERYWKRHAVRQASRQSLSIKSGIMAIATVLLLAFGLFGCTSFIRMMRCNSTDHFYRQQADDIVRPNDPFSQCLQSSYGIYLAGKEMKRAVEVTRNMAPSTSNLSCDSLDVVVIIGESYSKWHSQLYGYKAATTPLLCKERDNGQLFLFNDAVSPYSLTSPAMKNLLCCNSIADDEPWSESPYFPAIFKSVGYDVFLWDNQKDIDPNQGYSFALNTFLYNKEMLDMAYTAINEISFPYDYSLVDDFNKTDWRKSKQSLTIIHLMGQHFAPEARYPQVPQFSIFTADSIQRDAPYLTRDKKQEIAHYDNATLYNDYVVKRILDLYRERNAVVVYFSDHGEETYDYKDAIGRHYEGLDDNWLKYIHDIPFMIWCSEKYMASHVSTIEDITKATERPFAIDNICHLLFHLGEISTPYYIADRDVLSDKFRKRKRIVEGRVDFKKGDYDKIRKK